MRQTIGIIGVGSTGLGVAARLMQSGYPVLAFDPARPARDDLQRTGGRVAVSAIELVDASRIVLTCIPPAAYLRVAEGLLIPRLSRGQICINLRALATDENVRVNRSLHTAGAATLYAPLDSPPATGPGSATTYLVYGSRETYQSQQALLELIGSPRPLTYGGADCP